VTTVAEARRAGRERLRGVETPLLDVDVMLASILGWSRDQLLARDRQILTEAQAQKYERDLERRADGAPVAYVTGEKEWLGMRLLVDESVLIPRPETELLAYLAIREARGIARSLAANGTGDHPVVEILDVGTGSGAIAVAVARSVQYARVTGTDVSPAALAVARRNGERMAPDGRITWVCCDLLPEIHAEPDIIAANLPYIRSGDMATLPAEVQAEPASALAGGESGLDMIERLLSQVAGRGWCSTVLLEIDPRQATRLRQLVELLLPWAYAHCHKDLAGRDRVAVIRPHGDGRR
jgi:release factor glutamine methyltransferase